MFNQNHFVKVSEETIVIPTYEVGKAEKNPIFSEKRVYQGSSGKVYPYPVIEEIKDEKIDKAYIALVLENEYIKVTILPELGGRIGRAYDKTNDYDFVYYNKVIKPALVGLTGPWISGGIEFNWPQHHRPTTYLPTDYDIKENKDGSKSVLIHDTDQMYGTKGTAIFTLYPEKAYIEIEGRLYNRTPLPQTFLWWANPAVAVNEHTQSIFPPDVHAVMDHGKRDVSKFPIATGIYYKHDYSEGVDISRYKNIPVPTSYMAWKSNYDFVGGYDHDKKAGILHVADHHISPGKKQWTWGCGDFGKAWDKNLTDEDGPYIELMTGVYTDNQPDFTWLKPFEEKTFKQYFMPYKAVGEVKNANTEFILNFVPAPLESYLCLYATAPRKNITIQIMNKQAVIFNETVSLSPINVFERQLMLIFERITDLTCQILDENHIKVLSYTPPEVRTLKYPEPAKAAKDPIDIMTNEELFLTGLHLEQYRHATYEPDPYYQEGLKRDPLDLRINNAYGRLLFRRGLFNESEQYFRNSIERLTLRNPNPYDCEPYYNLGLSLFYREDYDVAYDSFYKAIWSSEQQEMGFYFLSAIECRRKNYENALIFVDKALFKNSHNIKSRGLKAVILRNLSQEEAAAAFIKESLSIDPFDFVSGNEALLLSDNTNDRKSLSRKMRDFIENYLQTARDYAEWGCYEDALSILKRADQTKPLIQYYQAYYFEKYGDTENSIISLTEAECSLQDYCFPNKLEDIKVLEFALKRNPNGAKAFYYLGTLFYDKKQYQRARDLWETSIKLNDRFPTAHRNLAMAYYNKFSMPEEALRHMETAFQLDNSDSRIFFECDQLYKKLNYAPDQRLHKCTAYKEAALKRDDMFIEYITMLNQTGENEKAYELLVNRKLHPWEGGEGKASAGYKIALLEMAKDELEKKDAAAAVSLLKKAFIYPESLGEGHLEGTRDNDIYYYLGCAYESLGSEDKAREAFLHATMGTDEPAGMMYYNDQPADMILYQGLAQEKLKNQTAANMRFTKLIDYGEKHLYDKVKIDYFAVSLPDLLIFEEDWQNRNKVHCYYLLGLGYLGFRKMNKAKEYFEQVLSLNSNHINCELLYKRLK